MFKSKETLFYAYTCFNLSLIIYYNLYLNKWGIVRNILFCLNINLKYVYFHFNKLCFFGLNVCVFTKLKVIDFDLK